MGKPTCLPQQNLHETVRRAFDGIAGIAAEILAERAGGTLRGRTIELRMLGRTIAVDLDRRTVLDAGGAGAPAIVAAAVARYLARCDGLGEASGEWIGFADDANARGYLGPFRGRVVASFLGAFGRQPEAFAAAAAALGGERMPMFETSGAAAYRIPVLPRIDLIFILHPGDEDLPAEGQVLFPREIFRAFAVDDAVMLADLASRAMRGRGPR
jgi:hypothetical protein